MDVDLKGSSIKRIMDNPGLAFVTQMVDKEILAKIYGENSKLYHESINFDVSKNNELPSMAVYSSVDDYERLSIERRFYLPRNVPVIMLYFYFYINFRNKLIPLIVSGCRPEWEKLKNYEKMYFENNEKKHKTISDFLRIVKGEKFMFNLKTILRLLEFETNENKQEFNCVEKTSRSTLFYEFVLFMGNEKSQNLFEQNSNPQHYLNTLSNSQIDKYLEVMSLEDKSKRLFALNVFEDIDKYGFNDINEKSQNSYEEVKDKVLGLMFNPKIINNKTLRLKKCVKMDISAKRESKITLNDCLSNKINIKVIIIMKNIWIKIISGFVLSAKIIEMLQKKYF